MNCPHCGKPVTIALLPGTGTAATPPPAVSGADLSVCPRHRRPWEHKSGISKKTGKAYSFWGCPVRDDDGYCDQRPTGDWQPPEAA